MLFIIGNLEHYHKIKRKENFFSVDFCVFLKLCVKANKFALNKYENLFIKGEDQMVDKIHLLKILIY